MLARGDCITEREIADSLRQQSVTPVPAPATVSSPEPVPAISSSTSLSDIEREHIVRTLQQTRGNKAAAARILGLSRRAFYRRLERHGLAEAGTPLIAESAEAETRT